MNQQEFKEKIFEERGVIKEKLGTVYDSKKLAKKFLDVFNGMDYLTFSKLPANEQREIVEKVFGSPELVFGKLYREELVRGNKLAEKRKKTKKKD